jgi:uncharacterized protein
MIISVNKVKNIPAKTIEVEIQSELDKSRIDDSIRLVQPVLFSGKVENTGKILVISGVIKSVVEAECCRCAEIVSYPIKANFCEAFSNYPEIVERKTEDEIHLFTGDEIDITQEVVQAILLELPMKLLCKEKCKGLCPNCGKNLNYENCNCTDDNIDPRLMVLKKFEV